VSVIITRRQILPAVAIVLSALLLIGATLAERTYQREDRWASCAQDNTTGRVRIMRQVQAERQSRALVARIERLSRGLIRQAQAAEIVRILKDKCDDAIKADMIIRLIDRESRWDPRARGQNGEVGLCQLKPSTAGIPAAELADPARNVAAGIDHLRGLLEQTGEIGLALAAYNAGLYSPGVRYARAILGE
jgi:hypothetical protein